MSSFVVTPSVVVLKDTWDVDNAQVVFIGPANFQAEDIFRERGQTGCPAFLL
jgi:hypothetical protein